MSSEDIRKNPFDHLDSYKQIEAIRADEEARAKEDEEYEHEDEDQFNDEKSEESETESKPYIEEYECASSVLSHNFERLQCSDTLVTCYDGSIFSSGQPGGSCITSKGYTNKSNANSAKIPNTKGTIKSGKQLGRDEVRDKIRQMIWRKQSDLSTGSTVGENYNSSGLSPVYTTEYHKMMDEMLDRCNRDTTLTKLVRASDMEGLMSYLQENKNSPRLTIEINTPNASHLTPLVIAIYQENYDAIHQLILHGADPSKTVNMGNNCFHLVAESDNFGMCLCRLLEFTSQRFSPKQVSDMLNAKNIFNASPLDVLMIRLHSIRNQQQCDQIEQMISIMRNTIAKGNQTFHSSEQSCSPLGVI